MSHFRAGDPAGSRRRAIVGGDRGGGDNRSSSALLLYFTLFFFFLLPFCFCVFARILREEAEPGGPRETVEVEGVFILLGAGWRAE